MADNSKTQRTNSKSDRPHSIQDALRMLDEALSSQPGGAQLKELVTEDFQHVRSAIQEMSPRIADSLRISDETYERVSALASDLASNGLERGKKIYSEVDTQVRSNPWPVIGGVAAGTFALGFLLGRNASHETSH